MFFPRSSFFALYLNLSSLLGFFSLLYELRIHRLSLQGGGGGHRASSRSLVRDTKIHAGGPLPLSLSLFFKKKAPQGNLKKASSFLLRIYRPGIETPLAVIRGKVLGGRESL